MKAPEKLWYKTRWLLFLMWAVACNLAQAQTVGGCTGKGELLVVNYQLTYDPVTNRYTAWYIPTDSDLHRMVTAQFTIIAPNGFTTPGSNGRDASFALTNINGAWSDEVVDNEYIVSRGATAVPALNGLSIHQFGLAPAGYDIDPDGTGPLTSSSPVTAGVAVPLFSFPGSGCASQLRILINNEPLRTTFLNKFGVNLNNSIYLQIPRAAQVPALERYCNNAALDTARIVLPDVQNEIVSLCATATPYTNNYYTQVLRNWNASALPAGTSVVAQPVQRWGTFTVTPASLASTVSIDPATGQYTVTFPTTGGVTQPGSVTICNALSDTCSSTSNAACVVISWLSGGQVAITGNAPICLSAGTATASLSATSGFTTYTWSGPGLSQTTGNPVTATLSASGTYSYTVVASSGTSCSATATTSVTVNSALAATATASGSLVCTGATLSLTATGGSANASYSWRGPDGFTATGAIVSVTNATTASSGSYTVIVTDASGCSATAVTSTVSVSECNRPPVAVADINNTLQNVPVNGQVLTNDSDPDGNPLSVSKLTDPTHGTVTLTPTGSYTYVPAPGFVGTDSFTYKVCDNASPSLCDTTTVTIEVRPPSVVPGTNTVVANNDATQTPAGTPTRVKVLGNDFDPEGQPLGAPVKLSDPVNGTVVYNPADSSYTYTPKPGFVGTDMFTYRVCDTGSPVSCDTAIVSIQVAPMVAGNHPPVAVDDATHTDKNVPVGGTVASNDTDPDGNPLVYADLTPPMHGTVVVGPTGSYTYTPAPGYVGPDQFTYKVCDNGSPSLCDTATAYVTVYDILCTKPVLTLGDPVCNTVTGGYTVSLITNGEITLSSGATRSGNTISVSKGTDLVVSATSSNTACSLITSKTVFAPASCSTTTPCTLPRVSVGNGVCQGATYTVSLVNNSGATISASSGLVSATAITGISVGTSVTVVATASTGCSFSSVVASPRSCTTIDCSESTLSIGGVVCNNGSTYSVIFSAATSVTVTATAGNVTAGMVSNIPLSTSVVLTATTGGSTCPAQVVSVQAPTNCVVKRPPFVPGEPLVTVPLVPVSTCLPIYDTAGDTHTATLCSAPASGTAQLSVNNVTHEVCVTYTAPAGFSGVVPVCIITCDQTGLCDTTYVPVLVVPNSPTSTVGLPPVVPINEIVTTVNIPGSVCMPILDPNVGDTHSYSVCGAVSHGVVSVSINNATHQLCVDYTPARGYVGKDALCLTVCDQTNLCTTITVPITVRPTPVDPEKQQPPYVTPPVIVTPQDTPMTVCTQIKDPNAGDTHTYSICGQPSSGTLTASVNNATHELCVSYTPKAGFSGYDRACVIVCDNGSPSLCDTVIVPITVIPPVVPSTLCTSPLGINVVVTAARCGLADGEITATVQSGVAPYRYRWNTNQTGQTITGLTSGIYSVTVTDANGCTGVTGNIDLPSTEAPAVSVINVIPAACGQATGSVSLSVTGGLQPYQYKWSTGSSSSSVSGLLAGLYTVSVTDVSGCSTMLSVTVPGSTNLTANTTSTPALCGTGTGSARVNISGGTAPYTYLWSSGQTGASLEGLTSGIYSVMATDAGGCSTTATATITNVSGPELTVDRTDVTCNGSATGTASVRVAGGTAPFTYRWSNGSTLSNLTGLTAGTYTVIVTDANNCLATQQVVISQPQPIVVTYSPDKIICPATVAAINQVSIKGGTGAYTYLWSNGSTAASLTGVAAGNYTVVVTDAKGCTAQGYATITPVTCTTCTPPVLTLTGPVCNTVNNTYRVGYAISLGASVSANAGTLNVATQEFTGIPAGVNMEVTATASCGSVTSTTILAPATCVQPISCTAAPTMQIGNAICQGTTYKASVEPSAGATLTAFGGTVNGTVVTGSIGSSVTVVVSLANCSSVSAVIGSPASCTSSVCDNPLLSLGGTSCNGTTYTVHYTIPAGVTVVASSGVVNTTAQTITELAFGKPVSLTASNGTCVPQVVNVAAPANCTSTQPCSQSLIILGTTQCMGGTYNVSYVATPGTSVVANVGNTANAGVISGIPSGVTLSVTATSGICVQTKTINPPAGCDVVCTRPTLTLCDPLCNTATGGFTFTYKTNGRSVEVSNGAVVNTANHTISVPAGVTAVAVTAMNSVSGCSSTTSFTVAAPTGCNQPACVTPTLFVCQPVCNGDGTYSVGYLVSVGASVTANVGVFSAGNRITVPVGTNVVVTATNNPSCSFSVTVESPVSCAPCTQPGFGINGIVCRNNGATYDILYIKGSASDSVRSTYGVVSGSAVTGIPAGQAVVLTLSNNSCPPVSFSIAAPTNCTVASTCVTLALKVLLEGPYDSTTHLMTTTLNSRGLLPGQTPIGPFAVSTPAGQPYNTAPWNYTGTESLRSYPADVVDWVLVSLRTDSLTTRTVFRVAGLLHSNGQITFVNPCFSIPNGTYFPVIEHRNHMGVMSPRRIPIVNNTMTFDFTAQDAYTVTDPPSFGEIRIDNRWMMYGGDGKKDTYTDDFDINFFDSKLWKDESGIFDQYRYGDFNLDADVNFSDSVLWNKNNGRYSKVPH